MEAMPALTWYFDVISPYAYLALPGIEALAATHAVRYRPIVLGAVLSHWGQLGPAEIAPKRLHTYRHCQFLAERAGLPFRFPPAHPFRSLDALRLLAAHDASPAATRSMMDFIWAEGRDPSAEPEALAARLAGIGAPAQQDAAAVKALLRRWTDDAIAAGVFGVPTLAVSEDLFWGADAMPMALARLADPGLLKTPSMARLERLPSGVTRRPGPQAA